MKLIIKIAVCAIALSTASMSFAQSLSGFYLGGNLTYLDADRPNLKIDKVNTGAVGAFTGYNYVTRSNVALGLELAYNLGKVDFDVKDDSSFSNFFDLKAKLGYQFGQKSVGYVFGGSSAAILKDNLNGNQVSGGSIWGVGYDMFVNNNVSIGAEVGTRQYDIINDEQFSTNIYQDLSVSVRSTFNF